MNLLKRIELKFLWWTVQTALGLIVNPALERIATMNDLKASEAYNDES